MRLSVVERSPGAENLVALRGRGPHRGGGQDRFTVGQSLACNPCGQGAATGPGDVGWATARIDLPVLGRRRAMRGLEHGRDDRFGNHGMRPS